MDNFQLKYLDLNKSDIKDLVESLNIFISNVDPGSRGSQGNTGATGSQGITGTIGSTGSQGNIGPTGSTGSQGNIGPTGSTGSQGNIGNTGSTGPQGNIGNTGSTGPQGIQGFGNTGSIGPQGVQGIGTTGSVLTATGSFTLTQFLNLLNSGTPIQIIPAPGSNLYVQPILFNLKVTYGGTPFVIAGGRLEIGWGTLVNVGGTISSFVGGTNFASGVTANTDIFLYYRINSTLVPFTKTASSNQALNLLTSATTTASGGTGSTFAWTCYYVLDTFP